MRGGARPPPSHGRRSVHDRRRTCIGIRVLLCRAGRGVDGTVLQSRDPDTRVHIVEIDQAVVQLRASRERLVRAVTFWIARPESRNLAALAIEVAAQLA